MYKIHKITSNPTVDFAAEELKKYLRMMMPREGEIKIDYDPSATDGFRLGLMSDFGLDTSEAEDLVLDDIVHIDTDEEGGIIAGSNVRSVLLAVYRYLRKNGCRWLFPGIDGEVIPMKKIEAVKYHKMADCRYRGQCNEGGEYQFNMMEAIDFTPKIGMNIFMIEFEIPKYYYNSYYNHAGNEYNREPEPVSEETILQWTKQCEVEIAKRGLQYHSMGHGWTSDPFGMDSTEAWDAGNVEIPEEVKQYVAMVGGERKIFAGSPLNTNFCMSNAKARKIVNDYIADYASKNGHVDYIHVWLADASNNHCECEECQKMIPTDWYVMMMNELDEELTRRGLDTRIVFISYFDTMFPAEVERIKNPKRFSMLFAPITRNYVESPSPTPVKYEMKKYVRNQIHKPANADESLAYINAWMETQNLHSLAYEYHFWINQCFALGLMHFAKLIHDDVKGYKANNVNGIIEDGSQRSFFPNGFNFYVYGETLFDNDVDYEFLKKDYFSHAYGADWEKVVEFFETIDRGFDKDYMTGRKSADAELGKFYNPEVALKLRAACKVIDEFAPFVEAHKNMPLRAQTVAFRLLAKYLEFCRGIAGALILKAFGAEEEAEAASQAFFRDFGKHEVAIERYYDQSLYEKAYTWKIFSKKKSNIGGL